MKQLNHSPEAAATVLGIPLSQVGDRIAWLRRHSEMRYLAAREVQPRTPRLRHIYPPTTIFP